MKRKALKAAFPYTIPIMTGFWFLGLAYGIYAKTSGFAFVYPLAMSVLIFGGSLEFLCVEMLLSFQSDTDISHGIYCAGKTSVLRSFSS